MYGACTYKYRHNAIETVLIKINQNNRPIDS